MKKVIIIGGGFSGLTAAQRLGHHSKELQVQLIDEKETFDFLPLLPDIISGRVDPRYAACQQRFLAEKYQYDFIQGSVDAIDLTRKKVMLARRSFDYDYLIIASGTQTIFPEDKSVQQFGYTLDHVKDALKIRERLSQAPCAHYVVVGGGYSGIELATHIWRFFHQQGQKKRILIIERNKEFLRYLSSGLRDYIKENLRDIGLEILTGTTVVSATQESVTLSNGKTLKDAMLLWTPGVHTGAYLDALDYPKDAKKRLKVDEYLRVNESCFVLGDAAYYEHKGKPLRMAVQFTLLQGFNAAGNIVRLSRGKPLKRYNAIGDLGYVFPMANGKSCGEVFGMPVKGFLATALHYFMCIVRSYSLRNQLGILKSLFTKKKNR